MPIKYDYIQLNDASHHIKWIIPDNSKSKHTLVFLHDALGSIPQWKTFPDAIVEATELSALIIERRGYGKSSPLKEKRTKNYLHHEAWVVLPKILEQLKIENPILIGHSDGATIALLYAAKHKIDVIISIAAHVFVEDETINGIQTTLKEAHNIKDKLKKYHIDKVDFLFKSWYETWLSKDFLNWNIEWDISSITCPLMIIQSQDDNYGTLNQVDGITNAVNTEEVEQLILDSGGHAPHLSHPDLLIKPISEFIKRTL